MSGGLAEVFSVENGTIPPYFPVFSANSQNPAPGILPEIIFPPEGKILGKIQNQNVSNPEFCREGGTFQLFPAPALHRKPRTAAITQPQWSDPLRLFLYLQPAYDMIFSSAVIESDPFFPFDIHGRRLIV